MRTIHTDEIIKNIKEMCIEANLSLTEDMKCRFKNATESEKSPLGKQILNQLQENMEIVCKLHPENVTIHTLALKKRAPLFHHELRAAIPPAEETGHMVRLCQSILTAGGYVPYYMYRQKYMAASFANIGYALPGSVSAYNIEMMEERQSVLAAGPGGATKFLCRDGHTLEKVYMPKDVDAYVQALAERIAQRRRLCAIIYGKEDV